MPDLSVSGMALFVAEIRADSVITILDVSEGLSGVFDIRHKTGSAEIEKKLEICRITFSESYERVISILHLLVFSGSAYSKNDIENLFKTPRAELRKLKVSPHHGGSAILELACKNEPMNLWFGYAGENRRSNNLPFDPHKVSWVKEPKGQPYHQMVPTSGISFKNTTTAERLLEATAPKREAQLSGTKTPPAKKNVATIDTPTSRIVGKYIHLLNSNVGDVSYYEDINCNRTIFASADLIAKIEKIKNTSELNAVNFEINNFKIEMEKNFSEIIAFIQEATAAGNEHYERLQNGLIYRKMETSEDFKIIDKCAVAWKKNRIDLLEIAKKYQKDFKGRTEVLSIDSSSNVLVIPKKFLLGRIKSF